MVEIKEDCDKQGATGKGWVLSPRTRPETTERFEVRSPKDKKDFLGCPEITESPTSGSFGWVTGSLDEPGTVRPPISPVPTLHVPGPVGTLHCLHISPPNTPEFDSL